MENLRVIKGKNHKERKERCLKMRNELKRGVKFIKCSEQSRSKHNWKIINDHLKFYICLSSANDNLSIRKCIACKKG